MVQQRPHLVRRVAMLVVASCSLVIAGCSSDADDAVDAATTTAPEERISSDADVAEGLAEMRTTAEEIAAAVPDTERAAAAADDLETVWQRIEGTVKSKEPDVYVDIEDAMSLLSAAVDGDDAKAPVGVADMGTAIDTYLDKHPA